MVEYEVIVLCEECGEGHSIKTVILQNGPQVKESVESFYAGRELPPELATINSNYISCSTTDNWFLQKNNDRVFLVPVRTLEATNSARSTQHAEADVTAAGLGDTGIRETGDILGASSTLAGAGGHMENQSKFGTSPTTNAFTDNKSKA